MIPVLKLPFKFDARSMREDLRRFSAADWTPHFNIHYYEGDWSGIALHAPRGAANALFPDPSAKAVFENTAFLERCAFFPGVLARFECELESARFLKLSAGSVIRRHRDYFLAYEDGVARSYSGSDKSAGRIFSQRPKSGNARGRSLVSEF